MHDSVITYQMSKAFSDKQKMETHTTCSSVRAEPTYITELVKSRIQTILSFIFDIIVTFKLYSYKFGYFFKFYK